MGKRTDDKCPAKFNPTKFKMLIENAGAALYRVQNGGISFGKARGDVALGMCKEVNVSGGE